MCMSKSANLLMPSPVPSLDPLNLTGKKDTLDRYTDPLKIGEKLDPTKISKKVGVPTPVLSRNTGLQIQ